MFIILFFYFSSKAFKPFRSIFPFFVIGEYGISGAQTTEGMKQTMLKVLGEEKLAKATKWIALVFVLLTLALHII